MPTPAQAIAELMQHHLGIGVAAEGLQLIATGASGRSMMRSPQAQGVLGIYWTGARADNAAFVPVARYLAAAGVSVPAILCTADYGDGCGACLVEDLGNTDILSLKELPFEQRFVAYKKALQALLPLHALTPTIDLQPPFDAAMYRWEQEYFAEHLVGRHLGKSSQDFLQHPALMQMADMLADLPRVPVHRDCQSQNIMLRGEQAVLIDFQGMRYGLAEYDIASLVYDPYMNLTEAESDALLALYTQLSGRATDTPVFYACAMQRLMQALGAFANIGYNQQREWYLNLIPTGLRNLRQVTARVPVGNPVSDVAQWLLTVI